MNATKAELGHDPIRSAMRNLGHVRILSITAIRRSPENDKLYRPVDPNDPEVIELAESIRRFGIKEPIVISEDGWILSGHRRFVAAMLVGLTKVPCRTEPIRRHDDPDGFLVLLREYNRQRIKSLDEQLREEVLTVNPDEAYQALIDYRAEQAVVTADTIEIRNKKPRAAISAAKWPFLEAVKKVIEARRKFWPLSDRQIHYALLNDAPLIHASKPGSRYTNNPTSYKAVVDLLTRARLAGVIPMSAIADETRPESVWNVWSEPQAFIRQHFKDHLRGYWRDLMQSQPNHLHIVGEKLTVKTIVDQVASRYCISTTIGRGYMSIPPRWKIAEGFKKSGKDRLVLLIVSDFDPDGEEIAHSLARSLRDDFGIENIEPIKVALTADQVTRLELPPNNLTAKEGSSGYKRFVAKYGSDVYELEALPPETLQQLLIDAIDSVIDVDAFNAEIDAEKNDAAFLTGVRSRVLAMMKEMDVDGMDTP